MVRCRASSLYETLLEESEDSQKGLRRQSGAISPMNKIPSMAVPSASNR